MKRLLLNYIRPLYLTIIIGLLLSMIGTILIVAQPLVIRNLINSLSGESTLSLYWNIFLLISIPILATIISYIQTFFLSGIGQKITQKLRGDLFDRMLLFNTEFLDKTAPGRMYQYIQDSIIIGEGYIDRELVPAILSIFTLIFTFISMWWMDIPISLIVLFFSSLTVLLTAFTGTKVKNVGKKSIEARTGSAEFLHEVLENIRTIRLFSGKEKEMKTWQKWLALERNYWMKTRLIGDLNVKGIFILIQSLCISIVIIYGYLRIQDNLISLGSLVAFITYVPIVFQSVSALQRVQLGTKKVNVVLDQLYYILDYSTERGGSNQLIKRKEALEVSFKNVDFYYPNRTEGLTNINISFKPGSITLIVGPSGVGKSTIIDLITCLYFPDKGDVNIAGVSTRDVNIEELRKQIGIVPQSVVIWNRTLKENLLYGNPFAEEISNERIKEIIILTKLHSFVKKLPMGLDEVLGPNAVQSSGGERQRIALARALLRNPSILIFDEMTSALDPILSKEITEFLWSEEILSTKLIVSHRLTFASRVDQILVVTPEGTIISGQHDDLLESNSLYKQLVEADQFKNSNVLG